MGELRDRSFENQAFLASGLNLLVAAIILWNTRYLQAAFDALAARGTAVPPDLMRHVAPLGWEHISLTGDYVWAADAQPAPGLLRPLRDRRRCQAAYEQALPLYGQAKSVLGEANCIKSLGDIALSQSDHEAAFAAYQRAMPLYSQAKSLRGAIDCVARLGDIALARSDYVTARMAFEQALPLYRQARDLQGEARCMRVLKNLNSN